MARSRHLHSLWLRYLRAEEKASGEVNMDEYFLIIWEKPKDLELRVPKEILRFYKAEDAWHYVLKKKIEHYSLHGANCIIDQS